MYVYVYMLGVVLSALQIHDTREEYIRFPYGDLAIISPTILS